jgi:hypothetical protein
MDNLDILDTNRTALMCSADAAMLHSYAAVCYCTLNRQIAAFSVGRGTVQLFTVYAVMRTQDSYTQI